MLIGSQTDCETEKKFAKLLHDFLWRFKAGCNTGKPSTKAERKAARAFLEFSLARPVTDREVSDMCCETD
jgi:hypothetical protein